MPSDLTRLSPGPDAPRVVTAVIEIEQSGANKYEYDAESGSFRLNRVLSSAIRYPADYGFIPRTLAGDGDPADILVLTTEPTFPGCLVDARPVGLLLMRDEHGEDEKVLAVPVVDERFAEIQDLEDLPAHLLREIEHFFTIYKELTGLPVETFGWRPRDEALTYIDRAIANAPD